MFLFVVLSFGMVRHTALLKFYANTSEAEIESVSVEGAKLPAQIPSVSFRAFSLGRDLASSPLPGHYDFAFVADFDNQSQLLAYSNSDAHKSYHSQFVAPIMAEHLAVDYQISSQSVDTTSTVRHSHFRGTGSPPPIDNGKTILLIDQADALEALATTHAKALAAALAAKDKEHAALIAQKEEEHALAVAAAVTRAVAATFTQTTTTAAAATAAAHLTIGAAATGHLRIGAQVNSSHANNSNITFLPYLIFLYDFLQVISATTE